VLLIIVDPQMGDATRSSGYPLGEEAPGERPSKVTWKDWPSSRSDLLPVMERQRHRELLGVVTADITFTLDMGPPAAEYSELWARKLCHRVDTSRCQEAVIMLHIAL
jgi:hypothetical protein